MTSCAAVQRLGDDGHARRNAKHVQLIASLLDDRFCAARRRWWHEDSIRCAGNVLLGAKNADIGFNLVVIRSEFVIGNWPVIAHPVGGTRFEIYRSKSQRDASPVIGAATDDARPKPAKARSRRRGVRFAIDLPCAVRRRKFVVDFAAKLAANANATVRQIVRPEVFFVIFFRIERRAGLEHDNVQPAFGQNLGGRATPSA